MTKPQWYKIRAAADAKSAEIDILDEIGSWGIRASDFIRDLRAIGEVSDLTVNINSPGGDVFDGLAVFNVLSRHSASVTCRIEGIAASIASVIAMAGDRVVMPENAFLMIHDPSGFAMGTSEDMRELADVLDKVKSSLISAYRQKTGMEDDEIAQMMSDEVWLTAQEAKSKGFCDEITAPRKMAANAASLARFTNVPAALVALAAPGDPAQSVNHEVIMTDSKKPEAGAEPAKDAKTAEPAVVVDLDAVRKDAEASVTARLKAEGEARIKAIRDLCVLARAEDKALDFIASGKSADDVRAALIEARAKADEDLGETAGQHAGKSADAAAKANNYGWDSVVAKVAKHRVAAGQK